MSMATGAFGGVWPKGAGETMRMNSNVGRCALVAAAIFSTVAVSRADTCLASGDPTVVQGASVATFEALGINPAVTCIENALWTDPSAFILGSYVKGANTLGGTP